MVNSEYPAKEVCLGGTKGRKKLCMLPCHSFYIYRTWKSKELGEFKVILWGGAKHKRDEDFFMGGVDASGYHDHCCQFLYKVKNEFCHVLN